ncbi:MAG: hypothetical protein HY220_02805 [Candidatus Sungbacteria bacterium]|uniref:Endonuclease III n=1 Tax=Candidatus Sungiibacteriota bacterium TaxID=2750080 RepID=A0A9D6LRD3_9BACT|nr:hypothetical protein [Candidatus Sungbacteria bacterium]
MSRSRRAVCQARSPKCVICPLNKICPSRRVQPKSLFSSS